MNCGFDFSVNSSGYLVVGIQSVSFMILTENFNRVKLWVNLLRRNKQGNWS